MILIASDSVLIGWSAIPGSHDVLALPQDVPLALETIRRHQPTMVVLEEAFAVSAEAAAFIARLQTDPEFSGVELRILTAEGAAIVRSAGAAPARSAISLATLTRPMPHRAARIRPTRPADILVDGKPATLVNMSQSGTQVCSTAVLRPGQRVRLSFPVANRAPIRTQGVVIWSAFELAAPPIYRAGIKLTALLPVAPEELIPRLAAS